MVSSTGTGNLDLRNWRKIGPAMMTPVVAAGHAKQIGELLVRYGYQDVRDLDLLAGKIAS
jgi:hypothetical protein